MSQTFVEKFFWESFFFLSFSKFSLKLKGHKMRIGILEKYSFTYYYLLKIKLIRTSQSTVDSTHLHIVLLYIHVTLISLLATVDNIHPHIAIYCR